MEFTLGSDVELFGIDSSGKHRALCGLVGGTKEHPKQMEDCIEGFAYQEDNVAVEFNIPPAKIKDQWFKYIIEGREKVKKKLQKELGLQISSDCAVSFTKEELVHPNALVFGCEPDYDAWKLVENKKPICDDKALRTAGGHVHVGCDCVDMIKGVQNMDLYLGVPSVLLDDSEKTVIRRKLYGKAGAMRPKPYGWEYRSLSNFWVFDDNLINWVWDATKYALIFRKGFTQKEAKTIQNCINTGDKNVALKLIKQYNLIMPDNYEQTSV